MSLKRFAGKGTSVPGPGSTFIFTIVSDSTSRGCIDKNLRKNISPKIKCKVWIL
jgi:hypothetical protein